MGRSVAAAALLSAGLLFLACGFSTAQGDKIPADMVTRKNPVLPSETVLAEARKAYEENCLQCHGAGGKGDGPMAGMYKNRPADLTNQRALENSTDGEIFWLVTKGEKPMPSFEGKLNEEERWNLVHLMRAMSNTQPNSTPKR